jgi:uncharacterized protein (TIGR02147 family)
MVNADKVRLILLEELARAQARNPGYSMRAFAKRVGISQPAISQILAGKRPVTRKTAEKILRGLDKDPQTIATLFQPELENTQKFKSLDMDSYHLIADWHYYAILSLAETKDFLGTPKWIAARLGIGEALAKDSVERLLRLDLLERDPKTKKLRATGEQLEAMSAIANPALKKASRQNIELAQKALEETEFAERDFTAITLCFDPDKMAEAKQMIKNFRRNFCKVMEAKPKKEVYKLSIQLFPLTKRGRP